MDVTTGNQDLFGRIDPYDSGRMVCGDFHEIYWEQSGNPKGAPVIFVHGGPGAGAGPIHRRFFDPEHYRIVIFDQRGSGRSRPIGEIRENTTQHLIDDMERLRDHLGVEKWLVFGGSWGAALGLAYAEAHPEHCTGLIIRGVFLGRMAEVDWFLNDMGRVFPEAWRDFVNFLPEDERSNLLDAYYNRLMDPDPTTHLPAARVWSAYEGACSTLLPRASSAPGIQSPQEAGGAALALARLEAHYFVNKLYLRHNQLLQDIHRVRHLPGVIVQGRYDMVCPIATADELARAWPEADYVIVPDAGHSAMEPGIRRALVRATEKLKKAR